MKSKPFRNCRPLWAQLDTTSGGRDGMLRRPRRRAPASGDGTNHGQRYAAPRSFRPLARAGTAQRAATQPSGNSAKSRIPRLRMRLMIVIPQGSGVRGIKQAFRTHSVHMPVAEKAVIILPVRQHIRLGFQSTGEHGTTLPSVIAAPCAWFHQGIHHRQHFAGNTYLVFRGRLDWSSRGMPPPNDRTEAKIHNLLRSAAGVVFVTAGPIHVLRAQIQSRNFSVIARTLPGGVRQLYG